MTYAKLQRMITEKQHAMQNLTFSRQLIKSSKQLAIEFKETLRQENKVFKNTFYFYHQ